MELGYRNFRVGIRVRDNGQAAPIEAWTPWASEKPGDLPNMVKPWSSFATNLADYDPDGLEIGLEVAPFQAVKVNHDFRVAIGAVDKGEPQQRPPSATPWLSQILGVIGKTPPGQPPAGYSAAASDYDFYDPDRFYVGLSTNPGHPINGALNFHLAARVLDAKGQGQPITDEGQWVHTPNLEAGGGWSPIAFDFDRYDFDAVQIAIVLDYFAPAQGGKPGQPW